jgi:ubiquinone/menaquinone biosynthesis C-methylase UbiE
MAILDIGCGLGSIALDFASTLAPGRVVGVDVDPGQIEAARKSATERGIDNAEFFTSSVYELPLPKAEPRLGRRVVSDDGGRVVPLVFSARFSRESRR